MSDYSNRRWHYFISYSHKDTELAEKVFYWLTEVAGLDVWMDRSEMKTGGGVGPQIAKEICDSKGVIALVSSSFLDSNYTKAEMGMAVEEKTKNPDFSLIPLRLEEDLALNSEWAFLRYPVWMDLKDHWLNSSQAAEILCQSHASDGERLPDDGFNEVFVSRGWRDGEESFADEICRALANQEVLAVGDLKNQKTNSEERLLRIMKGCSGHLVILPDRKDENRSLDDIYKYFIREVELSRTLGLPVVVVAEPGSEIPDFFDPVYRVNESEKLKDVFADFCLELELPEAKNHSFYAGAYKDRHSRNELARRVIQAVGTLPCYWGGLITGDGIQEKIIEVASSARFAVADLTNTKVNGVEAETETKVNTNACIEAGVTRGAGVETLLFAQINQQRSKDEGATRHIPYMFRNSQILLYKDDVDFLGKMHKAVFKHQNTYGRRVINREL